VTGYRFNVRPILFNKSLTTRQKQVSYLEHLVNLKTNIMKKTYLAQVCALLIFCLLFTIPAQSQLNLPRGSQAATVTQRIGISDVSITYSRPRVNDREIWGSLVPYGMNNLGFGTATASPWRAGANENTVIHFSEDAQIEGQAIPAGEYGLHMIVNEDDSATIIFSENTGAWGSYFYEPSEDVLRVSVRAEDAPHTEWLQYEFTDISADGATARLRWEEKAIPFRITMEVSDIVLQSIRRELQNQPGFNRQSWEQAANYALNNNGDLEEALGWIDAAIAGQFFSEKNFTNLNIKAQILNRMGRNAEADGVMREALAMGTVLEVHGYGRQLIAQGRAADALEVFQTNAKQNKNTWPVDLGLARGYSAVGQFDKALKHLKIAEGRAPDLPNKNAIAANIEKLEKGEDIN
jgi:tetratricopeptide (TPR) repeat protein